MLIIFSDEAYGIHSHCHFQFNPKLSRKSSKYCTFGSYI